MQFCDDCGTAMVKADDVWVCRSCDPDELGTEPTGADRRTPTPRPAAVSSLPTTDSGSVKKADAMRWLAGLDRPTDRDLRRAFVPKPRGFTGSTYPTSISNVRITGDPAFVETVAGLLEPIRKLEAASTRVEINLQRTESRETGELTGNYALYLSVAERG